MGNPPWWSFYITIVASDVPVYAVISQTSETAENGRADVPVMALVCQ